jgi:hypothetical protein
MRFVRVRYDACDRQFKPMTHELSSQVEDGAMYLLAEFSADDFAPIDEAKPDQTGVRPASRY